MKDNPLINKSKVFALAILILLVFTGCSQNAETENSANPPETTTSETTYIPEQTMINDTGRVYKLENNVLYGSGENYEGILGSEGQYDEWIEIGDNVKMFDAFADVLMYLTLDGEVYGLGAQNGGILQTTIEDSYQTITEPILLFDDCKKISLGCRFALAQKNDGSVWFWGESLNGQSMQITDKILTPIKILDNAKDFKAIGYTTAWIDSYDNLYMCGDNSRGQIGNGMNGSGFPTQQRDIVRTPYLAVKNCSKIYCSENRHYVYADTLDGATYMWGGNEYTRPTNIKYIPLV